MTTQWHSASCLRRGAGIALACCLSACGGGSSGPETPVNTAAVVEKTTCTAPQSGPSGVFGARLSPGDETMLMIAREDGQHIGFFGQDNGVAFAATAAWRLRDKCGLTGALPANAFLYPSGQPALVETEFDPTVPSITGQVRTAASTRTIAGGRIPGSAFDYQQAPSIASAAGTFGDLFSNGSSLTILADGSAVGTFFGCQARGHVAPQADGKNLLTVSMALDLASCPGTNKPGPFRFDGVALTYALTSGGTRRFAYLFATDDWDWSEFFMTSSSP